MPKTVVKVKTFMCPLGVGRLGQPDACRFHRAHDNPPADGLCPVHKQPLVKATLSEDCMTMMVMGEEDIGPEIEERTEATYRERELASMDKQIAAMDAAGEFATAIKRERFRAQRQESLEQDIERLKADEGRSDGPTFRPPGYFLRTPAGVASYRARRQADIARAIVEAKRHEDV